VKLPKKYLLSLIAGFFVIAIVAIALIASPEKQNNKVSQSTNPCGIYRHDAKVAINGKTFDVEMPKDHNDFTKGLAGRPCITDTEGMLFRFTKPGQYPFWMKGMNFPIDIIWIGSDYRVAAVEVDEMPSTYPDKFVNKKPAQYVLEIKANLSKRLKIQIGTPVTFQNR
jgi:uncharacterized membrane protein (UPF0127 family)